MVLFMIVFGISMVLALAWITVTLFRGARMRERLNAARWAREAQAQGEACDRDAQQPEA